MLNSYLRKDVKYTEYSPDETTAWISLASFGEENLQSYNLVQNLLEFFCVYVLHYALPSHTRGSLCKIPGQYVKAGIYHGRQKNMYQAHKTSN